MAEGGPYCIENDVRGPGNVPIGDIQRPPSYFEVIGFFDPPPSYSDVLGEGSGQLEPNQQQQVLTFIAPPPHQRFFMIRHIKIRKELLHQILFSFLPSTSKGLR